MSVGPCLVNCCLQIGQDLVITYVIFLPLTEAKSPVSYHARRLPENLRLCRSVAQNRSAPAHIAETTSVYDFARPNSTIVSLTCRMKALPQVGSLSRSAVDRLLEGRIGSYGSLQVYIVQLPQEVQHLL